MCLKGSCDKCSGLQNLQTWPHVDSTHEICQKIVSLRKYNLVTYGVKDDIELKRFVLVKKDICEADFMKVFQEKLVYEYIVHIHRARWLDN